jgi:surface antigen
MAGVLLLLGGLVGVSVATAGAAAASTGMSTLCTGFAECASAGYPNFGYSANYTNSYWGQYGGHNCTNYVAYRFTAVGVAKPSWLGHGNAVDWGLWAPGSIVNATPTVGAIAWWGPSSAYAQYGGHVSIVQRVNADGSFIDSDDNYDGDFHWREYSPGGSDWPTAFIHYDDAALGASGTPPTITTASLPTGQAGHDYSATLQAAGGASPYTWSLSAGSLPSGLTLSGSGTISGTPAGPADSTIGVTVTGADGSASSATLTLWVPAIAWGPTVSKAPSQTDTYFRETNGCLYDAWWNPSTSGVSRVACGVSAGGIAAVSKAPSQTDTYFRETNGCL